MNTQLEIPYLELSAAVETVSEVAAWVRQHAVCQAPKKRAPRPLNFELFPEYLPVSVRAQLDDDFVPDIRFDAVPIGQEGQVQARVRRFLAEVLVGAYHDMPFLPEPEKREMRSLLPDIASSYGLLQGDRMRRELRRMAS
jgi:hypothetical protein